MAKHRTKKPVQDEEYEKRVVFNTESVEKITNKINDGVVVKRYENPWFKNEIGIRRAGISFSLTEEELTEYFMCKMDIHYFAEKYCKIKVEDGSVQNIKLRDYQKEILDLYTQNRFSILCASRQVGKTINAAITMLHFITFNNDKNIMIVANIAGTTIEIIDKIKAIYAQLPFFLKTGVKNWNQKSIVFENGCRIKTAARSKTPAIGFTIDFLYLDEFAHIPSNIIEPYYTAAFPTVSAIENSKIIITSTPNGMNMFHKLLTDAERPDGDPLKNNYKAMRVYWHQVPGRFVTYYRLNHFKMKELGISKDYIYQKTTEEFAERTKVEIKFIPDLGKDVIYIFNNDLCTDEEIKQFRIEWQGVEYAIQQLAEVTTWKEEAIKDIGGEDAFNQEYGLRFVNATRSLLNESLIENLLQSKVNYEWMPIEQMDSRLNFSYKDLRWAADKSIFDIDFMRNYSVVMSIDLSEGLGQDYSVINIFAIDRKPDNIIQAQIHTYKELADFTCLKQIGIFRSNWISLPQLAELFYVLAFECFNPDNVKVVLEVNTYGGEFLARLPYLFDGNNDYGNSVFYRYKHRIDAQEEKIGIRISDNKNLLVKEYQENMQKRRFLLSNEENIKEITTFVKHTTNSGNIKYAADIGNDDTVMTLISASTVFDRYDYKEVASYWLETNTDPHTLSEWQNYLLQKNQDLNLSGLDYDRFSSIRETFKHNRQYGGGYNISGYGNMSRQNYGPVR